MATYYATKPINNKDTKIKISYKTANNNIYDIYKDHLSNRYYIVDKNGKLSYFTSNQAKNYIDKMLKQTNNKGGITITKDANGNYGTAGSNKAVSSTAAKLAAAPPATNLGKTAWQYPIGYDAAKDTYYNSPEYWANAVGSGGSGSGYGGGIGGISVDDLFGEDKIGLIKDAAENTTIPKVWNKEDLVKFYGVEDEYDMDKLIARYNEKTNKYYGDAIAEQEKDKKEAELNNSRYVNELLNTYVNSYNNAAPTAMGRGTLAANALTTLLGAAETNEAASSDLRSIINDYKESQKAELANNPVLAEDWYNNVGKWLVEQGVNTNSAEVKNYINDLAAYQTAYAGVRNAQKVYNDYLASAYETRAANANTINAINSQMAEDNLLRRMYQLKYLDNETGTNYSWQKAYNNTKGIDSLNNNASGNVWYNTTNN